MAQWAHCAANSDCCDGLSCGNGTCYKPWIDHSVSTTSTFRAIMRPSTTTAAVVGDFGTIYRLGTSAFAADNSGTSNDLLGLHSVSVTLGTTTTYYYAAGRAGEIRIATETAGIGSGWFSQTSGTSQDLYGIAAANANDIWAVGANGVATHNTDSHSAVYTVATTPTTRTLRSVYNLGTSGAWAVGDAGTILNYSTSGWVTKTSPTSANLAYVRGTSASDIWSVGAGGVILHYNGASWSTFSSPTSRDLTAVWGYSASDAWATGKGGLILHYVSGQWSIERDGGPDLFSIRGSLAYPNDVWAVGASGTILQHWQ